MKCKLWRKCKYYSRAGKTCNDRYEAKRYCGKYRMEVNEWRS
jgi:hypothetical protein